MDQNFHICLGKGGASIWLEIGEKQIKLPILLYEIKQYQEQNDYYIERKGQNCKFSLLHIVNILLYVVGVANDIRNIAIERHCGNTTGI